MNNSKHYDLRICVESIHKGNESEARYARKLLHDVFGSDVEEFRVYFGLKETSPVLAAIAAK